MFKKLAVICIAILLLISITACEKNDANDAQTNIGNDKVISVGEYMSNLSAEKTAHIKQQIGLLLHPLKDAVTLYGDDYELSWEGNYVKLQFKRAKCSFEAYAGAEFEHYDWYNNYIDFDDCNVMEYLSYATIERVILDGEGMMLTDGISIGMSARRISETLNVAGINYRDSGAMITSEYDSAGKKVNVYHISGQLSDIDYIVVFKGDILSRVEIANYTRGLAGDVASDHGKQILTEAFSFVLEKGLATFDVNDLSYTGEMYSPHYDSWFDCWQFVSGDYEGFEIGVEENSPNRIYIATEADGFPILFWCNGEYASPMLSFLGKWREHNSNEYIEIKSISTEGVVVFDMYVEVGADTGEMVLLQNLNTAINEIPQTLDAYFGVALAGDALDGDTQLYNGEVQSGYYTYDGQRIYLIDSLLMDLNGSVKYLPRSLTGRVGTGTLSVHIPNKNPEYSQVSTWGYMESFGRDDSNDDNFISTNSVTGGSVINDYLNALYKTSGLQYADLEYKYLYDYIFPVNNVTYNVWQSNDAQSPHYLYVDNANELIIKECQFNLLSRCSKSLIYKDNTIVSSKSYADQRFVTLDGKITVDLANRTITKTDSFVKDIELPELGLDAVGENERFMFFSSIGERFDLNGYILFDHTTWGATLHITDSNVPNFDIGVYYLNAETFFLDPTIGVIGVPEEDNSDKYLDDKLDEMEQETKLVIREFGGKIIGYIYVDGKGDKTVKNFSGKILGYYYADRNVTTNFSGKILAQGDISSALLFREENS